MEAKNASTEKPHEEIAATSSNLRVLKKDDFYMLAELGEGSYSTVYLASDKQTRQRYAIKICSKRKITREKKVQQIFRERDILRLLSTPEHSNPFIVCLFCTFQDADCLYFVLTLAERKDLLERLKANGSRFDVVRTRFVMAELWAALAHIHSLNVVHRDVKPENILLRQNGHILLSDFGSAKLLNAVPNNEMDKIANELKDAMSLSPENKRKIVRRCSFVGTAQYVSPEMLNGEAVSTSCDWWAFGVILFELLAGRRPFSGESEYLLFQNILKPASYEFPLDFVSNEARLLIQQILVLDPGKRPDTAEIQASLFFAAVDWANLPEKHSPLFDPVNGEAILNE